MSPSPNIGRAVVAQVHTDVAALSAGVIAVAVTTIVVPGQYGGFGTIMAVTLLILIISYSWSGTRTLAQSIAFAAVIGLIGMQVFAFLVELWDAPHPMNLLQGSDYGNAKKLAWERVVLETCLAGNSPPDNQCPDTYFHTQYSLERLALDDKSRVNGGYLMVSWFIIGAITLLVDRGFIFAGRWWPNSIIAKSVRVDHALGMQSHRAEPPGADC
jgi:hypothetical protein